MKIECKLDLWQNIRLLIPCIRDRLSDILSLFFMLPIPNNNGTVRWTFWWWRANHFTRCTFLLNCGKFICANNATLVIGGRTLKQITRRVLTRNGYGRWLACDMLNANDWLLIDGLVAPVSLLARPYDLITCGRSTGGWQFPPFFTNNWRAVASPSTKSSFVASCPWTATTSTESVQQINYLCGKVTSMSKPVAQRDTFKDNRAACCECKISWCSCCFIWRFVLGRLPDFGEFYFVRRWS